MPRSISKFVMVAERARDLTHLQYHGGIAGVADEGRGQPRAVIRDACVGGEKWAIVAEAPAAGRGRVMLAP